MKTLDFCHFFHEYGSRLIERILISLICHNSNDIYVFFELKSFNGKQSRTLFWSCHTRRQVFFPLPEWLRIRLASVTREGLHHRDHPYVLHDSHWVGPGLLENDKCRQSLPHLSTWMSMAIFVTQFTRPSSDFTGFWMSERLPTSNSLYNIQMYIQDSDTSVQACLESSWCKSGIWLQNTKGNISICLKNWYFQTAYV